MKKIYILFTTTLLLAQSPFESPKENRFELSQFDTSLSKVNKKAMKNQKIKCRYVCDKKVYKEQKIADAISFYKASKDYNRSW